MNFLIGFFLPALIGLVIRYIKDPDGRFWASAFICAVVGIFINFVQHNGNYTDQTMVQIGDDIGDSIAAMIGIVKLSHELFWDNKSVSLLVPDKVLDNESLLSKMDLKPTRESKVI